ncbi:response regulator receiver domain-containing protein [Neorhizobium sp. R1-B]|jgi:DNA-binding response OmpR family regulator|uniref:response regulator n=1 Tax=Neorhizobium TaxID=1525371 RepID=UPI000CFA4109|nr:MULTISPECIES: response regulator [Neorhizobium]TCV72798.1 response regulator receiver domain-containing protein [Neorhizobium sp. S3-V5DH]TDX88100.1 response regulator receiver domain-containing protein [Neorhizobium sp. R1-B]
MKRPTILLLEDQPLVSWDVEEMLRDAGLGEAVMMASCRDAEAWLVDRSPDAAVLDIFLRDGECVEIAETLVRRNIPFVVHSAHSEPSDAHAVFLHGQWISKPADPTELLHAIRLCLLQAHCA